MATTLDAEALGRVWTILDRLSKACSEVGVSITNALLWIDDAPIGALDVGVDGKVELRIGE